TGQRSPSGRDDERSEPLVGQFLRMFTLTRCLAGSLLAGTLVATCWVGEPAERPARARATLAGHQSPVHSLAFAPDGSTLTSAGVDGTIRLWDLAEGEAKATLEHQGVIGLGI